MALGHFRRNMDLMMLLSARRFWGSSNFMAGLGVLMVLSWGLAQRDVGEGGLLEHQQRSIGENGITSLSFSPDGAHFASGHGSGNIVLWDNRRNTPGPSLRAHSQEVTSLVYSPDSSRLASASLDGLVKVRQADDGYQTLLTLFSHNAAVYDLSYSPDGRSLASAGADRNVILWDGYLGSVKHMLPHQEVVYAVSYSPDGDYVFSASAEVIYVWRATTGELVNQIVGHQDVITDIVFSPDGRSFASTSWDTSVIVWDSSSFEALAQLRAHNSNVFLLNYDSSNRYIISLARDGYVLWELYSAQAVQHGQVSEGILRSIAFAPDSPKLLTGSTANGLGIWELVE